ncbi:MAG: Dabb family protein [Sediminibacterium sp.]
MKKIILFALLLCTSFQIAIAQSAAEKHTPILRHVVMFKFADKATPAEVKKIEEAFRALKSKIALIKDFEWGVNNSPEKLNGGLTHCFFVTFSSEKDRDAYLVHPDHKAFVAIAGSNIEKATVLDYWAHK